MVQSLTLSIGVEVALLIGLKGRCYRPEKNTEREHTKKEVVRERGSNGPLEEAGKAERRQAQAKDRKKVERLPYQRKIDRKVEKRGRKKPCKDAPKVTVILMTETNSWLSQKLTA